MVSNSLSNNLEASAHSLLGLAEVPYNLNSQAFQDSRRTLSPSSNRNLQVTRASLSSSRNSNSSFKPGSKILQCHNRNRSRLSYRSRFHNRQA
jgi:hypothetical protein